MIIQIYSWACFFNIRTTIPNANTLMIIRLIHSEDRRNDPTRSTSLKPAMACVIGMKNAMIHAGHANPVIGMKKPVKKIESRSNSIVN